MATVPKLPWALPEARQVKPVDSALTAHISPPHHRISICCPYPSCPHEEQQVQHCSALAPLRSPSHSVSGTPPSPWPAQCLNSNFASDPRRSHELKLSPVPYVQAFTVPGRALLGSSCDEEPSQRDSRTTSVLVYHVNYCTFLTEDK